MENSVRLGGANIEGGGIWGKSAVGETTDDLNLFRAGVGGFVWGG